MEVDMTKPYEILDLRYSDNFKEVLFKVTKTFEEPNKTITKSIHGYLAIPIQDDIDQYVYNYLKQSGWVD